MSSEATRASWVRRAFWLLDNVLRTDVWIVQGPERISGKRLCLCYAGSKPNKNYLADLVFSKEREEQYLGKNWIWKIKSLAKNFVPGSDAVIVETRQFYCKIMRPQKSFFIPCWVRGDVSIPISVSNRSAKEDRRRVRKNKLTYAVTKDLSKLRRFYEDMYLPFVKKQHGDQVFFADFAEIVEKVTAGTCELLLILDQDEAIAGQLIVREAGGPRLWSFGLLNGDLSYSKKRTLAASFLFSSEHLSGQGYGTMKLGDSRAFLNDGVLQYKMKWGMELTSCSQKGYLLHLLKPTAALKSFLSTNPFFHIEDGKLSIVAFVRNENEPGLTHVETALENAHNLGVVKSRVYSFSENPEDAVEGNIMSISSAKDLFA